MKILYFDLNMGAAGDMLTAALLELFDNTDAILAELNGMGIPHVQFYAEEAQKCGIHGTHMSVKIEGCEEGEDFHFHATLPSIRALLRASNLSSALQNKVYRVYRRIAEAESKVHDEPVTLVHFHEVGALDAVADVSAVCYLMEKIGADKVVASPIHVGSGSVKCAHGILPVPAPATEILLHGIPTYGGEIRGELCTPTGAALIAEFVHEFGSQPVMAVTKSGYGCGKKDFPRANVVRTLLGQAADGSDEIEVLKCNLDDCTPEEIGYAMDAILALGALDVFTTPIGMKKNRPGVMLTVLCRPSDEEKMVKAIFKHTTTLGIRKTVCTRFTLEREISTVTTPYGDIRCKTVSGYGVKRSKPEYEDLARIAREQAMSLTEVKNIYFAGNSQSD